ncbi:MAG TPA: Fe-S cluster assembly protein SufD [Jiangellales bacterium]|nr:Fe-S cluster assembly protein SufD [Jiangellales bacterium]
MADHPVPTGREEDWRFTPLPRLRGLLDDTGSAAHLSWTTVVPAPADLTEISSEEALSLGLPAPGDRVAALAARHSGGAVRLRVPAGAELDEPVLLQLRGTGGDEPVHGHLVIDVGPHAKATVVLEHSGSARYAELVSVRVGDGASLDLVGLSLWDDDAVHAGQTAVQVGRDARVRAFQVSLGGDLVRLLQTVSYTGPGGDAELLGLYFADAGQHLEHRLFVDHSTPHCRSNVLYKGALQGESAHTVWIGDVLIRPEAVGTDTFELNRNLVLTDGARADSVPNLEIETGEVESAGHASATGRFDDEQLFYLQARGIPAEEARRLVVRGFFAELLGRIGVPEVRDRLMAEVDRELAESLP